MIREIALAAVFVLGASAAGSGDYALRGTTRYIGASGDYAPTVLSVDIDDGRHLEIATTSPETCQLAIAALYRRIWLHDEGEVVGATCRPGDLFAPGSEYIPGYNAPRSAR